MVRRWSELYDLIQLMGGGYELLPAQPFQSYEETRWGASLIAVVIVIRDELKKTYRPFFEFNLSNEPGALNDLMEPYRGLEFALGEFRGFWPDYRREDS